MIVSAISPPSHAAQRDRQRQGGGTPGRAVATQRDVLMFRTADILQSGPDSGTPLFAQRLATLAPAETPVAAEAASRTYQRIAALQAPVRRRSLVA